MSKNTPEVLEPETAEHSTAPAAMVLSARPDPGVYALAAMPEDAFEQRLELFVTARDRVKKVQRSLMTEDVHFGVIPGTKKPTLMKSGAEVLCNAFGLVCTYETPIEYGDGVSAPHITVTAKALVHLGDSKGPVIAEGMAACNSWEKHYRYRTAQLQCPACGQETIFKSKRDPEFFCWAKRGGCGATFPLNDERISKQERGQVENPDPFELLNTLIKMAKKRAKVDATLEATATSDLFTQDLEEGLAQDSARPPGNGGGGYDYSAGQEEPPYVRQAPPPAANGAEPATGNLDRKARFKAAVKKAGMPLSADVIRQTRDFAAKYFHAETEDLTDEQYDVLLDWIGHDMDLPPDYLINEPLMSDDVRAQVKAYLDAQGGTAEEAASA